MPRQGSHAFVLVDGWKGPLYDHIYSLQLNEEGSKATYVAQLGRKAFVVCGDWRSPAYDDVYIPLNMSHDGREFIYVATLGQKNYVILNGVSIGECETEEKVTKIYRSSKFVKTMRGITSVGISADGTRYAYSVANDGKEAYVVDGQPGPRFDEVSKAVFSPDGTLVAYGAKLGDEWFVVCGDRRSAPANEVWAIRFSGSGRQIGYGARIGTGLWWKVLNVG